jgi:hypothetical protein
MAHHKTNTEGTGTRRRYRTIIIWACISVLIVAGLTWFVIRGVIPQYRQIIESRTVMDMKQLVTALAQYGEAHPGQVPATLDELIPLDPQFLRSVLSVERTHTPLVYFRQGAFPTASGTAPVIGAWYPKLGDLVLYYRDGHGDIYRTHPDSSGWPHGPSELAASMKSLADRGYVDNEFNRFVESTSFLKQN